jgi:hypothetical protein
MQGMNMAVKIRLLNIKLRVSIWRVVYNKFKLKFYIIKTHDNMIIRCLNHMIEIDWRQY